MPRPVSVTVSLHGAGGRAVGVAHDHVAASMRSVPPSGIASREFIARFMTTCSSWLRSASTSHRRSSQLDGQVDSSPSVRRSSSSSASITRRSESTSGVPDWRRENSSSRRVSSARVARP